MPSYRFLFAHAGEFDTPLREVVQALGAQRRCAVEVHSLSEASKNNEETLVRDLENRLDGSGAKTIVGGFSLGARIAAMLSIRQQVAGLVGLSFPFHRHSQPHERHGLATLERVTVPTLLIQGTRDSHGSESQVRGMGPLPQPVTVMWLSDANHRWKCRGPKAASMDDLAIDAAAAIQSFAQGLVSRAHV